MEATEAISLKKFQDLNTGQKEEVYESLLDLEKAIDGVPKKSLRKTLELCLFVLRYKGDEVVKLQNELQEKSETGREEESQRVSVIDENEKLNNILKSCEEEKSLLRTKVQEMTQEIMNLQKRLQENTDGSDKDSSDPLSELDRKEELLKNINWKNKHIKRLLREIEDLQLQNIDQSKTIILLENQTQHLKSEKLQLSADITLVDSERKAFQERINELDAEIIRLQESLDSVNEDREKSEKHLKGFISKLETKLKSLRSIIDDKNLELKRLRSMLELQRRDKGSTSELDLPPHSDTKAREKENHMEESFTLLRAIEERDKVIQKLESKIKSMAEEMIVSTNLMNRISAERKNESKGKVQKMQLCCKTTEAALRDSNDRCKELSEMVEHLEEDNKLKATQAFEAITALQAYQRGEDGLVQILRKCSTLEEKLQDREKQIRDLVKEVNSMQEISNENIFLRQKFHIPDDVGIATRNIAAKERSKEKIIERLRLKLRASEEMRLQLKLEKSDLRKQLMEFQQKVPQTSQPNTVEEDEIVSHSDSCNEKEVGEVSNSIHENTAHSVDQQEENSNIVEMHKPPEWEDKYMEVVEENENLRNGMYEILDKIRDYDATSDHITIDTDILSRLLDALNARSANGWNNHAMRLQNELIALRERELALREKIYFSEPNHTDGDESSGSSIESVREDGEICDANSLMDLIPATLRETIDTSTRPTTPNKSVDQSCLPIILSSENLDEMPNILERNRFLELKVAEQEIYQENFIQLTTLLDSSEQELKNYCSTSARKLTDIEIKFNAKCKSFEYLTQDFDQTLTEVKQKEMENINLIAELQKQLDAKSLELTALQREYETQRSEFAKTHSQEEFVVIQKNCNQVRAQMAFIVQNIFDGKMPEHFQITENCTIYGIVNENLELDFIAADAYEQLQKNAKEAANREMQWQTKCSQLEGILNVAQEQVLSQQRLINEITDNHINLRHLVADLQSTSEDKFLIAKIQRELNNVKLENANIKSEKEKFQQANKSLEIEIKMKEKEIVVLKESQHNQCQNDQLKLRFLQKALLLMREKYFKFTPLILLESAVYAYAKKNKSSKDINNLWSNSNDKLSHELEEIIASKFSTNKTPAESSDTLIKLIKSETKIKYLEEEHKSLQQKYNSLHDELKEQVLLNATEGEYWKTIDALFGQRNKNDSDSTGTAKENDLTDAATNTESGSSNKHRSSIEMIDRKLSPIGSPIRKSSKQFTTSVTQTNNDSRPQSASTVMESDTLPSNIDTAAQTDLQNDKCLNDHGIQTSPFDSPKRSEGSIKNQLVEALQLAEERQELLLNAEKEIRQTKQRINELEEAMNKAQEIPCKDETNQQQNNIIEKTILSFHTLLSEKDNSICKYQELLLTERQESQSNAAKQIRNVEKLNETIDELSSNIKAKDMEILELKTQLEVLNVRRNSREKLELATGDCGDNSLNEISDEKIEEMFEGDEVVRCELDKKMTTSTKKDLDPGRLKKIKNLQHKVNCCKNSLKVKEEEIVLLRQKVKTFQEREKTQSESSSTNLEIEQLRRLLEEKDKHINDLMETLNNFHDDQQQFITDSSNYSADQIAKLAADLTRTEATNKIYQTQLEALRRQLASVTQREKQARDLSQSLRNQLIKRPVVSVKTEINARTKSENMQKKIQALETELAENRELLQRQQIVIEAKRAKSASEVGLWEKQKRWQQNAEKLKTKLEETESSLEKTKSLLQSARNNIARLEKDKQVLEVKLARATGGHPMNAVGKCCRTPSCPNLHHIDGSKYTTSESPETYTGASSECSSPARGAGPGPAHCDQCNVHLFASDNRHYGDIINTLKARIEIQQRKILALELSGKGSNATNVVELEKLQEKLSSFEAQNIRLEAKNLQLQLDNDLLRQSDNCDRMQKRVKHLEDYIIALKEELAQAEARVEYNNDSNSNMKSVNCQPHNDAGQTILSLKRIVEKLRAENKYLKDGRRSCESRNTSVDSPTELSRLQQMYTESLDRISALQIELSLKAKCNNCGVRGKMEANSKDDIQFIKEQLLKKTQLLQKAKVLLTRAAAKEKVLKEQLALWKRKCSELQNVPVIDEISE